MKGCATKWSAAARLFRPCRTLDYRRHAAGHAAVTSMGEKFVRVAECAPGGHVDALIGHPRGNELNSHGLAQVHKALAVVAPAEGGLGAEDTREFIEHFRADLERLLSN